MRTIAIGLFCLALTACGMDVPMSRYAPQTWNNISVAVEARPGPGGMYEFLVFGTIEERKPVHDLTVSLRVGEQGAWIQAIQDGRMGVYRRALKIDHPESDILWVQLQRGSEQTVLQFPLKQNKPSG